MASGAKRSESTRSTKEHRKQHETCLIFAFCLHFVILTLCFPVPRYPGFAGIWLPRRVENRSKIEAVLGVPFGRVLEGKGCPKGAKMGTFWRPFWSFFRKGRFREIDDSITRNAYFCLSRGTQKRSKKYLKSVPEIGTGKGTLLVAKWCQKLPKGCPKGVPK